VDRIRADRLHSRRVSGDWRSARAIAENEAERRAKH